jgi:hypothetical protein
MEHAQRVMLCAWLNDPEFSDTFYETTASLTFSESIQKKSVWSTWTSAADR